MTQVPAATRALSALRLLAQSSTPLSAATIAKALGLPRSTTYHLLTAMAESGFVVHLPAERRWGLGVSAFEVGAAYRRNDPLVAIARPVLTQLVKQFSPQPLAAQLGTLDGIDTLYLLRVDSTRKLDVVTDVGVRLPAVLTASGRAILTALPPAQVRADFKNVRSFVNRTGLGPTDWTSLRKLLDLESTQGFSEEDGFIEDELASIAAPILNQYHYPVAAVGLTYSSAQWRAADRRKLAQAVVNAARTLSYQLGDR